MARILRGDIYWADLNPVRGSEQAGRRPVLVISHDILNQRSHTVIVLAITSQPPRPGFPLTCPLPDGALPKPSWVKINQIRTIAVERLGDQVGQVAPELLAKIVEGLNELVG